MLIFRALLNKPFEGIFYYIASTIVNSISCRLKDFRSVATNFEKSTKIFKGEFSLMYNAFLYHCACHMKQTISTELNFIAPRLFM